MKNFTKSFCVVFILMVVFANVSLGQIAAWQLNGKTGSEVTIDATTIDGNLNTSTLTRGSGLTASALANAYGSTNFTASGTKATAISGNKFILFTINSKTNYQVSLSTLDVRFRRSSTGPNAFRWQYSTDGTNFTDFGSADISYTATTTGGDAQTQISLSSISALQNVPNTTTITIRLLGWGATATSGTFAIGRSLTTGTTDYSLAIGGTVTPTGGSAPTVTSPTFNTITNISAILGGNITSDGGSAITSRGTVWKTTTGVLITDNLLAEGNTTTGVFSHIRTLLPSGSQIFFKAYAINGIGTTLSSESSFWTLSTEPLTYSTTFTSTSVSQTQIDLSFDALSSITNAAGYIIMQKTGAAPVTGIPTDGNAYSVGNTIGDATVAAIVTNTSATSTSITGLSSFTNYYFTLIPFNNGSNNATYNYKIDGTIPTTNATTKKPNDVNSYVSTPTTQINPILISSLLTTDPQSVEVFRFKITDVGTDLLPTKVTQITINAGTNNVANWSNTIQGAKLSADGGSTFVTTGTPVIASTSITIPIVSGNLNISNGSSLDISLFIYLRNTGLTDNQILEFNVPTASHGFIADATGSTFLTNFVSATTSNQMSVDVVATQLRFVQQPTNTGKDLNMSPAVTIEAIDVNNNRDLDKTGTVSLISSGVMTGSPVANLVSGFGTFGNIVHTATGTGITLTASLIGFSDLISSTFNIIIVPVLTELILPQYIQGVNGTNNNRVPYAYLVTLSNLTPSATYRYYNTVVISSDLSTSNGAGNAIYINTFGNFVRSSGVSMSSVGNYSEFTTDASGTYTGWFITEPTGNATRFLPGNTVYMRIMLNDGAGGTTEVTRLTTTNGVIVNNFGTTGSDATGIRGTSTATAKNFILLYDNVSGTGRPISGTFVENDGTTGGTTYPSFYQTSVEGITGAWGTLVPNTLPNGIRRIEQRSLFAGLLDAPGDLINFETSTDGVWNSSVNTVNPSGGATTPLIISNGTLPISLSSFTSSINGRKINLNWLTASEINNKGFEIQRSEVKTQNSNWSSIGFVNGKGNSNTSTNYSFEDRNLQSGKYLYRLKQIDNNGNYEYHNLNGIVEIGVPKKFDLSQNYPNPFNPVTKINFDLPEDSRVSMKIYDVLGREIQTLVNDFRKAGYYTVDFNASSLSSGIYFYRFIAGKNTGIKKMMVIK